MKHFIILCCVLLLASCMQQKQNLKDPASSLPAAYRGEKNDSTSVAKIQWQKFFNDSLLVNLINTALANNPDIMISGAGVLESQADSRFARAALFPRLDANTAYWHRKFGLYTMDGAGNISTDILPGQRVPIHLPDYYIGLQSNWEIDIWKKLRNKKKAALHRALRERHNRNFVQTQLIAEIAARYNTLVALDHQLQIVRRSVVLQENALALMQIQKNAGQLNDLAVRRFESQVLTSQAIEINTKKEIREIELLTAALTGSFGLEIKRSADLWNDSMMLHPLAGSPADLLALRPDVLAAEQDLMANEADLRAARAAFYPALGISAGAGFQAFMPTYLFVFPASLAYSFLTNLSAPILNRAEFRRNYNVAGARRLGAYHNYRKVLITAYTEVCVQLNAITNLQKVYALKKKQADLLNTSIEITMDLFKSRRANYVEVLMVQQNLLETELELISISQQLKASYIQLYKVLGGGWQ